MESEIERHLRIECELSERAAEYAGRIAALAACLEFAVEYASHGTVPSEATVAVWAKHLAEAKVAR
jgi:hypothetical protein